MLSPINENNYEKAVMKKNLGRGRGPDLDPGQGSLCQGDVYPEMGRMHGGEAGEAVGDLQRGAACINILS